jgi:nuclease-like protein
MKRNNKEYRSAIKVKPLRRAGQSLEEKIDDIINEKGLNYATSFGVSLSMIIFVWAFLFFPLTPITAIVLSILALISAAFFFKKVLKVREELQSYKEGLRGERFMGDHLDELRETGCKFFHDFVVENIDAENKLRRRNIDHIVVNSKGIFAIETKALRKNKAQSEELSYDGSQITYLDGRKLPKQPLAQAKTSAIDIKNYLLNNIGEKFTVQPVVIYPGWYINNITDWQKLSIHEVWVCNEGYLGGLINSGPDKLSPQQLKVISSKLSDYIRNYERKD